MKKMLFSVMIAVVLSSSAMQPLTYAKTISAAGFVEPYYDIQVWTDTDLKIQNRTATCYSSVSADNVVKITAEQTLQIQGFLWSWSTYDNTTWTKTVNSGTLSMSNTKSGLEDGKYRLKTVFTLTDKDGKTKTITVYSSEEDVP